MELTEQDIHNIGMNHIGKELQKLGYEFLGVNSNLKKHPQFVAYKKKEKTIFVIVNTKIKPNDPWLKDEELITKLETHAKSKDAKLWYAGVEISHANANKGELTKEDEIFIRFNGFEVLYDSETLEI